MAHFYMGCLVSDGFLLLTCRVTGIVHQAPCAEAGYNVENLDHMGA